METETTGLVADKKLKKERKHKDKADRKEKKRSDADGVRKDKKDKKQDKVKQDKLTRALDAHLQANVAASTKDDDVRILAKVDPENVVEVAEELVPFAKPLADDKTQKKLFKLVKRGSKLKAIHRGVKECEKAIKKCPPKKASSSDVPGLVIIAGDISPMEVVMHFPILCEEYNVPYMFVKKRAELGLAASTKRATSVVMLKPEGKKDGKKDVDAKMKDADDKDQKDIAAEYQSSWKDLVKLAQKEWTVQVEPWVKGIHPSQLADKALS